MNDGKILVAPSVLAANWGALHDEVRRAEAAGGDWLHLDVMDGHFVDNISFGPAFAETVARVATVPLDVHLMISRPDRYFPKFTKVAHTITVHLEADHDVASTLRAIRDAGCHPGLAINPPTPFSAAELFLDQIDLLLIMTVNPGFGGQSFIADAMPKVAAAHAARTRLGLGFHIEVDGGIDTDTAPVAAAHGADVMVAGTSLFAAPDMAAAVRAIRGG